MEEREQGANREALEKRQDRFHSRPCRDIRGRAHKGVVERYPLIKRTIV